MSKRPTEPDSSHQPPKKPKTSSVFRSAVPRVRVTPTVNEPSSSGSLSRSTVVTLSKSDDGRRHASGKIRNRQERPSTHPKDQITIEPSGHPDYCDDQSTPVTPEPERIQNKTETSKTKRHRNNNNSVSHYKSLPSALSNLYCPLDSSTGMAITSSIIPWRNPSTWRSRRIPEPVNVLYLQEAKWHSLQVRGLHRWRPAEVSKLYSFRAPFTAISPSQGKDYLCSNR